MLAHIINIGRLWEPQYYRHLAWEGERGGCCIGPMATFFLHIYEGMSNGFCMELQVV